MMTAHTLMIQGTMSSVGKSLMVAALCRILRQNGLRVAPFKAQNMALNSFVTRDGLEIGRAQAMQAEAAGIDVTVEMNPVLIKPEADSFAQIVVQGKPWARLPAGTYMRRRSELWQIVTTALDSLRRQYDVVIIEGAGSPVELNLRRGDLVNMAIAEYADAPVVLVGDIDRGGIFAQLLGTLMLLEGSERARVRGLLVNKFRGDRRLFDEGVQILAQRGGVPVLGVVPFVRNLRIADEDSVVLDEQPATDSPTAGGPPPLEIVVVRLPHMSNFDDFDPLRAEPGVNLRFVERVEQVGQPDLLILPGTKTTIADLAWLRERGLSERVVALAQTGGPVLGICGGYQMLGQSIHDPHGAESDTTTAHGLNLLPVVTTFATAKHTTRSSGYINCDLGLFVGARGLEVAGYEIHMGHSAPVSHTTPLLRVTSRGASTADTSDGAVASDGLVAGTYFHGLFDNNQLRSTILSNLAARKGITRDHTTHFSRATEYDRLAATVRAHIDETALYRILGVTSNE